MLQVLTQVATLRYNHGRRQRRNLGKRRQGFYPAGTPLQKGEMVFADGEIGLPLPLGARGVGHKPDVPEARAGFVWCGQVATT